MRKHIAALRNEEEDNEINLTPMLDVVFIMLIFFIVTATFIKETGLEANRPDQNDEPTFTEEDGVILVLINGNDDIYVDGQAVDMRSVRPRIEAMHAEDSERPMLIQTHPDSKTSTLVGILDQAAETNIQSVSIVEL